MGRVDFSRFAPLLVLLAGPVAVGVTVLVLPGPRGHWSDHLLSGAAAGGALVALVVAAWWARGRLGLVPVLVLVVLAGGMVLEVAGNVVVGRSIWATPYGDDEVSVLAAGTPGFERGHELAEWGDIAAVLCCLALALYAGVRRWVSPRAAWAAAALALFPPWVVPALGAVFVLTWTTIAPARTEAARR